LWLVLFNVGTVSIDITFSYRIKGFSIPVAAIFDETANVEALQELMK
jgi:hypothetical protein